MQQRRNAVAQQEKGRYLKLDWFFTQETKGECKKWSKTVKGSENKNYSITIII